MQQLSGKNILLGITGGIAAYKSAELTRLLKKAGANVRVVLTPSAAEFVTPLTLQALSGEKVFDKLLDANAEAGMSHIALAKWADRIVIAPATANLIAKLSQGLADDLLTTLCLASPATIMIAPAMNQQMWRQPATQDNVATLQQRNVIIMGPTYGSQACGDIGPGRMIEPDDILSHIASSFGDQLLTGKHVLITAGPTREAIDPVRFISNRSTGKMGYALAHVAAAMGANVTLVSGPTELTPPHNVDVEHVITAEEMHDAVMAALPQQDIIICAAAVTDYRPRDPASQKRKTEGDNQTIECSKNPDILATIGHTTDRPFLVGFAAETENLIDNAKQKLHSKQCDIMIANDVSSNESGFASDNNAVTIITHDDAVALPKANKVTIAHDIIQVIAQHVTGTADITPEDA